MAVILIVEDETILCDIAGMMVEDWGHEVLTAHSVEEALVHLRSSHGIDALFTDIHLRSALHGGCDLAHLAIELRPGLRVLYTTGNSSTEKLRATFVPDAQFIGKPYSPQQLQDSIEGLLAA
ncbi:MAG: response regulator [Nitrospirota bacterium]